MTSDRSWKTTHDQRWMSTCKKIARAMTGVQHLRLYLQICDWPSQLSLSARWAKPLFYLKGPRGLDQVDLFLDSSGFGEQRLEAAARMVEREMMSDRGRAHRQLESDLQTIARLEENKQSRRAQQRVLKDISNVSKAQKGAETQGKAKKVLAIKMGKEGKRRAPWVAG